MIFLLSLIYQSDDDIAANTQVLLCQQITSQVEFVPARSCTIETCITSYRNPIL